MENCIKLLGAVRRMDKDAIAQTFDLYAPAIYNYAFRMCANARMADEVVEGVFTRFLEHLSVGGGPNTNLRSYLFEIAYHLVVDEIRYRHRIVSLEAVELSLQDKTSIPTKVENRIVVEAVLRAIKNDLTEDQKHVIILRFMEGFSVKETAVIMEKSVSCVKVLQFRAVAALRRVVDDNALDYKVVLRQALV